MSYSAQTETPNQRNCGHHHVTIATALHCRKWATERRNKLLLKGSRCQVMWELAVVIDNATGKAVLTPKPEYTSCPQCGKPTDQVAFVTAWIQHNIIHAGHM
jgi:hypothetical protein